MRVAYLTQPYPHVSHTFVLNEVLAMRRRGVDVVTFSVRRTPAEGLLSDVDRAESASTTNILDASAMRIVLDQLRGALRHPGAYARTIAAALRNAGPGLRAKVWATFYVAEAMVLLRLLDRAGIDHIHVHFANVASEVARLVTRYRRASGRTAATWSFTMHGSLELHDVKGYGLTRKAEDADAVVCISEFTRGRMMMLTDESHWSKLHVRHVGLDAAAWPPRQGGPRASGINVLTVARLEPEKGVAVLIDAVALLPPDVTLTVVGDGGRRDALQEQVARRGVADRVTFTGAVGHDHIAEYYAVADVFCLASFDEGVPVTLMEAMASGVPVVATQVGGVSELVIDGVTGLLARAGSVDSVAAALARLRADEPLRAELSRRAREMVATEFSIEKTAEALESLFVEITQRTGHT